VKAQSQEKNPKPPAYDITRKMEEEMVFKLKFTFSSGTQRKISSVPSLEINCLF
jgi:hypothetical protein